MKKFFTIIGIIVGLFIVGVIAFIVVIFAAPSPSVKVVNKSISFQNKLVIPPLLESKKENGENVFDLTMQDGTSAIFAGKQTRTLGFNGAILGPTIRAHTGDKVRMRVTNNLDETTTVHWHGMHLPAVMDGGPHQTIAAHTTWQPNWTITNEAATLWYHPHTMGRTAQQVYAGLAGLFVIDDANSDSLNLPKEYGIDDIPLVVQDKKIDSDGQFVYDHNHMMHGVTSGMLGDTILVNGTYAPYLQVPAKLVRLRLLNGSNARRYNFGFSDNRSFYQIAIDGGFLPHAVSRDRVQLAPGERAEILVNLSDARDPLTLISYPVVSDTNKIRAFALRTIAGETDADQQFKILELRPEAGEFAKQEIPQTLNTIQPLQEKDAVRTREFALDASAINGKKMDASRIDEVVHKGDVEIWSVMNASPIYHPFHIHGVQFLVLDRDGSPSPAYEAGWKDTITVNPEEKVRLIMRFPAYADPSAAYMFHCHILEHEDMGMMGQFVVVDKSVKDEDIKLENKGGTGQQDMQNMHDMH